MRFITQKKLSRRKGGVIASSSSEDEFLKAVKMGVAMVTSADIHSTSKDTRPSAHSSGSVISASQSTTGTSASASIGEGAISLSQPVYSAQEIAARAMSPLPTLPPVRTRSQKKVSEKPVAATPSSSKPISHHEFLANINGIKCPKCNRISMSNYAHTLHMATHNVPSPKKTSSSTSKKKK